MRQWGNVLVERLFSGPRRGRYRKLMPLYGQAAGQVARHGQSGERFCGRAVAGTVGLSGGFDKATAYGGTEMGKYALGWLIGIPIPILLILYFVFH